MKKDITYFGEIDVSSPQKRNEGQFVVDNCQVELDLNFYDGVPDHNWVDDYENYIKNIKRHKSVVEAAIRSDYEEGGDVKEYVDFHLEELDSAVIDTVLEGTDTSKTKEERLLSALKLVRIGFYPAKDNYAVWDYTIGRDIADQVVVVNTDTTKEKSTM